MSGKYIYCQVRLPVGRTPLIIGKASDRELKNLRRQSSGARKQNVRRERERLRNEKKRDRDAGADAWAVENELFDDDNP